MSDAPELWRNLLEEQPDDLDEALERVARLAETGPKALPAFLGGSTDAVFQVAVIRGKESVTSTLVAPLLPHYQRATEGFMSTTVTGALGVLGTAGLLAATGYGTDPGELLTVRIEDLLERRRNLSDQQRTSLALACAALRYDNAIPVLVGGSVDGPFEPDLSFGPDAQSYARYLATAAARGARAADFTAAWTDFVVYFALRVQTRGLRWTDLMWAGYGAYTRIFGYQPGEVAQAIHEFVHEVARG